jgi:hypothetical protein
VSNINLKLIAEMREQLGSQRSGKDRPHTGDYVGRVVNSQSITDTWGRPATRTIFEITDGAHAGHRIRADLRGHAERLVKGAASHKRFRVFIYDNRSHDGSVFSNVDVETIQLIPDGVAAGPALAPAVAPSVEEVLRASHGFDVGFICIGTVETKRRQVRWHETFNRMAWCENRTLLGRVVFGSTYAFNHELAEHEAANARNGKPNSLAGYAGMLFSPLLTFDIDRKDAAGNADVSRALDDAIRLYIVLLESGIPPEHILLSFSGNKGFHLQLPSMLVGAKPSRSFATAAGSFCRQLASEAGVVIDASLYNPLQPLRAPNSRNEKSGLFKIALTPHEFLELSAAEIQTLAKQPRAFDPPSFVCEPIQKLVELWRRAEHVVSRKTLTEPCEAHSGTDTPRIFQATWDFLINGAVEGERATQLFKAAANLSNFATADDLARALLERPVRRCGLPQSEATRHIESGLSRAASPLPPSIDRSGEASSSTSGF